MVIVKDNDYLEKGENRRERGRGGGEEGREGGGGKGKKKEI